MGNQVKNSFDDEVINIKINEISEYLASISMEQIPTAIREIEHDDRSGVKKLIKSYEQKYEKYQNELQRLENMHHYENNAYAKGFELVAGIDEVGRGPLAGPVMACVIILPKGTTILDINDSKKLSEAKRNDLYNEIMEKAIDVSLGAVNNSTIDDINILQATYQAMTIAIENLRVKPDMVLVDAVTIPHIHIPQNPIVGGDAKSISIAAASIIAKVTRDKIMYEYHNKYPQYSFNKNKGYGSSEHINAIKKYGLCEIHRTSFAKKFV